MPLITGQDLIDAGWQPGPHFPELLSSALGYEERGITDPAYILKLLERDFEKQDPTLTMRDEPIPFSEAIEATFKDGVLKVRVPKAHESKPQRITIA